MRSNQQYIDRTFRSPSPGIKNNNVICLQVTAIKIFVRFQYIYFGIKMSESLLQ